MGRFSVFITVAAMNIEMDFSGIIDFSFWASGCIINDPHHSHQSNHVNGGCGLQYSTVYPTAIQDVF